MKITETTIAKLEIQVENMDPVTVLVEGTGTSAEVILKSWDKSYTAYWGSMGGTLEEFIRRTSVCYMVNCFDRGISTITDELDVSAMEELFVTQVRKRVVEMRKEEMICGHHARDVYNECALISNRLESIHPEHTYDTWKLSDNLYMSEHSWEAVFYDEDDFTEWMDNNCPPVYVANHEYSHLEKIVEVFREGYLEYCKG